MSKSLAAYVNLYGNLKSRNSPDVVHRRPFTQMQTQTHKYIEHIPYITRKHDRIEMNKKKLKQQQQHEREKIYISSRPHCRSLR